MTRINPSEQLMTITQHLSELKRCVLITLLAFIAAFSLCYSFADKIYYLLLYNLTKDGVKIDFIYTAPSEGFFTYIKLSGFGATCLTCPIALYQLYKFLAPALYHKERKMMVYFAIISPMLFLSGMAMAYFLAIPLAWNYFASFAADYGNIKITLQPRISEYLSFAMQMLIGFGLAFQLPLILFLLACAKIIDSEWLVKYRRCWIVLIFIIAAILTPPDAFSQISLAIPMLALYEITILAINYAKIKKHPE